LGEDVKYSKYSITVDSSFLINIYMLKRLDILCKIYDEVLVPPTVKRECLKIEHALNAMPCIKFVDLSKEETKKVSMLHKEIQQKFPGEHRGEVEALVVASSRKIPLMISDNFAPWYLKSKHAEIKVILARGFHAFVEGIETKVLKIKNVEGLNAITSELEGIYPRKTIEVIRKKFKDRFK
jgi:predicted nucleic acid-binding protein